MQDYEKLGVFYLGREYDPGEKKLLDNLLLYDSRDLLTHAIVVGMTGSGKTGLCINIIEEAVIDNVPVILIDPKGDLSNLLLTFPDLQAEDFLPWVNGDEASRQALSIPDFAASQAALWQKSLEEWGQTADRIKRLRASADFAIYTPGSNAGIPVSILNSFAAPPPEVLEDGELLQERISATVTGLLGLLNIDSDPLQSREHILMSTIIGLVWRSGQYLVLAAFITQIQTPPVSKIGVLELESFYPAKDRFGLMMALNNLLASPGFGAWLEGDPLDIRKILYGQNGKPRVAIFSIAHLSDNERMFFVSLFLNQVLGWMRTQPGTTSLRALLFMDEILGYFPPVATPPSKKPLLTLLKQARAFGLGLVLATQNPTDLDYKGLANIGTWFIGRLQTERDKERLMNGLDGASIGSGVGFDRQKMEQLLSGLTNRVFLMKNSHEDHPVVFQTRWSLSYLPGPLTRVQVKQLMDPYKKQRSVVADKAGEDLPAGPAPASQSSSTAGTQPTLPVEISQYFIALRGDSAGVVYRPVLVGGARLRFSDLKAKVEYSQDITALTPISDQVVAVNWDQARQLDLNLNELEKSSFPGVKFGDLPGVVMKPKIFSQWGKDFENWLYGSQTLNLLRSPSTGWHSEPAENERDFRIRLQQFAREQRDSQADALRKKYNPKITGLQEKLRKAEQAVAREAAQVSQAKMQTAISFGATLLGAFAGRKLTSASSINKASSAIRGVGRSMQQQEDVGRAEDTVEIYKKQLDELNTQFADELAELESKIAANLEVLEPVTINLKKTGINILLVSLVWAPYRIDDHGQLIQAW